jgi:hypothetical protein
MVRRIPIVRTFAIFGFCIGILLSTLSFFLEWRGLHTGPVIAAIALVLFPAAIPFQDYPGGNDIYLYLLCLFACILNGFFYALVGLIVQYAVNALRQRSHQSNP